MLKLTDLVKLGLLSEGDCLVWKKNNSSLFEAILLKDGQILTSDGVKHASPSGAARHVNHGISTNGWRVWQAKTSGKTLANIRDSLGSTNYLKP